MTTSESVIWAWLCGHSFPRPLPVDPGSGVTRAFKGGEGLSSDLTVCDDHRLLVVIDAAGNKVLSRESLYPFYLPLCLIDD